MNVPDNKKPTAENRPLRPGESSASRDFWQALKAPTQPDELPALVNRELLPADVIEIHGSLAGLDNDTIAARRKALCNMLEASNARFSQASRTRRPVFCAGLQVRITAGPRIGQQAEVLDADYIKQRVLLKIAEHDVTEWVAFNEAIVESP